MDAIKGLHHVTAITSDPQQNIDFYRNVLGQRLVKRTVNFDAPDTYHFYFADEIGNPGSVLTFFAWSGIRRGVRGNGEANAVAYNVRVGALPFWQERLQRTGVALRPMEKRFGENVLAFEDPDGMRIELVETDNLPRIQFWKEGPIPQEYALHGFHSVTLWLEEVQSTAELLTDQMGYRVLAQEEHRHRFVADSNALGHFVDLVEGPEKMRAKLGVGSIHHIAFRAPDDEQQLKYQALLRHAEFNVTEVLDRTYFHSIYFRERGGVLFEVATDTPGFVTDEPVNSLGEHLKLPEWLEINRAEIEKSLLPIELKSIEKVG